MKYCDEYAPALSAFADGELTEQEKNEVLAHAETCEGCRTYLAELMTMRAAFGGLEEYDAPAGFAESVMARLHEEAAPKKRTQRKKWMGLAACAAVVLMAAVLFPHVAGSSGAADSAAAVNDCDAAETEFAQEPPEDEEFTDMYTSVQHTGMSLFNTAEDGAEPDPAADSVSDPAAETKVTPEEQALTKNESHAVFYALSDDAEIFLIEQGMGEQVYEANDEICSYLTPVELVREMEQQGLLTETGLEMTALDDVAEGSVIVVVRMAEVQP